MNETINRDRAETSLGYRLASAVAAFVIWGGWAYVVNHRPDSHIDIVAMLTQGSASFIITLFMVRAVTALYRRIAGRLQRVVLPAVITVAFTGTCLYLIHHAAGTPKILPTITPPLSVAFGFCIFTGYKLSTMSEARGIDS